MQDIQLLIDLHKRAKRQGPGGDGETIKAINLAMLDRAAPLKIADIGCGTGASAMTLARTLNAQVTAVDFLPEFIDVLNKNTADGGLSDRIDTLVCSMDTLPFSNKEYDVIWSEGAIYNMGFEAGIKNWKRFLPANGVLVVSEITWTTDSPPEELKQYWDQQYPEIGTASSKMAILENTGYSPLAYFLLPEHCWLDNYYKPMQQSFGDFLSRNNNSNSARAIVAAEEKEMALYDRFKQYYGYGVYIASNRV